MLHFVARLVSYPELALIRPRHDEESNEKQLANILLIDEENNARGRRVR